MRTLCTIHSLDEVTELMSIGVKEVILEVQNLSRYGLMTLDTALEIFKCCHRFHLKVILAWDVLMTEEQMAAISPLIKSFKYLKTVRVRDLGCYMFLRKHHRDLEIHLLLDHGNHNIKAVRSYLDVCRENLTRIILSSEIPINLLKKFTDLSSLEVEVMAVGFLPLFYSPRKLLSHFSEDKRALAFTEDHPHRHFPIVENEQGTILFNSKIHFILNFISELREEGISHLRFDRHSSPTCDLAEPQITHLILKFLEGDRSQSIKDIEEILPVKTHIGFLKANRTDKIFVKIKNKHLSINREKPYVGEVVDVKKNKYLAVLLRNVQTSLSQDDSIIVYTPDGKKKKMTIGTIKNAAGNLLLEAFCDDLIFLPYLHGISIKSMVFIDDE